MKTLKSIMMGLSLLIICGIVNAAPKTTHDNIGKAEVVSAYLNAVVHGKLNGIENAIDDDAQFNIVRGNNVNSMNKDQLLASLKSNENIEQECKCTDTAVQEDDDTIVHKVEMKYSDFTRTDLITAQREGKSWKIIRVNTTYN
jgi:hypothetical protein